VSRIDNAVAQAKKLFFEKGSTVQVDLGEDETAHYGPDDAALEVVNTISPRFIGDICAGVLRQYPDLIYDGRHQYDGGLEGDAYSATVRGLCVAVIEQLLLQDPAVVAEDKRLGILDDEGAAREPRYLRGNEQGIASVP
jgi:hypothetical protein